MSLRCTTKRESFTFNPSRARANVMDSTVRMSASLILCLCFMGWNILIQPEEVIQIIVRFNRDHTAPSFLISFRHAILLIATHEVYVNSGFHRPPKLLEKSAYPRYMEGICGRPRPVCQQGDNKRSAAIAKGSLARGNLACR